jgi:predicted NUDIX family NTP pyrophosphohydrolase
MASRKLQSAGLLLFRGRVADLEVLLGHPGGPFWQNKDDGAWSIPKGLIGADEAPLSAARREFAEEAGHDPHGDFLPGRSIEASRVLMVKADRTVLMVVMPPILFGWPLAAFISAISVWLARH